MNKKLILALILIIVSIGQSMANSYYAQLVAKVSSSSTGMGKVYARDTTSTYTGNFMVDSCASVYQGKEGNTNVQFFAYAQSTDESKYIFSGWSETDGGNIISKDNPYQTTVMTSGQATDTNTKYLYANFTEKILCKVNFVESTNGTYSVTDGVQTISGSGTISTREQLSFTAKPNDGYKLVGWYKLLDNGVKSYFSFNAETSLILTEDAKIGVDFIKEGTPLFIIKGGDKVYTDLNVANNVAVAGDIIYLSGDAILSKGEYTIKEGVTLLIPFDSDKTCYDDTNTPISSSTVITPNPYCTLTLDKDAVINVYGSISISSNIYAITTKRSAPGGHVNGDYATIKMNEGSSIIVNNGGKLYAWGYILGSGTVTAKNGSHIYEIFQLSDFRGGTCLNEIVEADIKVYPLNQYFIQNIEVPMTLSSGAEESVMTGFYGDGKDLTTTLFTFIGSNGLFVLEDGSTLEKHFDPENDRQMYNLSGDASIGSLRMKMNGVIVDSKSFVIPLTNNLSITIQSGTFTINNENGIALLPDSKLTVNKGAKLLIQDSKLYVYDEDEWGEYTGIKNSKKPYQFKPITSPSMTYVRKSLSDATLDVQGTVETDNGMLYTTKSGANICCTKGKGKIILNNGDIEEKTYQVVQSSTNWEKVEIPITPAQLKNTSTEDAAYTLTEDAEQGATFYFHQETGVWDNDNISTCIDAVDEANDTNTIWSMNGVKQNKLKKGLNIIKSSDGMVKKVWTK